MESPSAKILRSQDIVFPPGNVPGPIATLAPKLCWVHHFITSARRCRRKHAASLSYLEGYFKNAYCVARRIHTAACHSRDMVLSRSARMLITGSQTYSITFDGCKRLPVSCYCVRHWRWKTNRIPDLVCEQRRKAGGNKQHIVSFAATIGRHCAQIPLKTN